MLLADLGLAGLLVLAQWPPEGKGDVLVRRPALCIEFKPPAAPRPSQHVPYPPMGKRWAVDVSNAEVVTDATVARRWFERFPPVALEQVRKILTEYVVVSQEEWETGYAHVGGGDQGGWIVTKEHCFQWIIRPGGLAWIVYPDGTAVYLAASSRDNVRPRVR